MTTKNMDARREAFEKWAISTIGKQSSEDYPEWAIERNRFGSYASVKVEGAWIGYNAALDSICVELPPEWDSMMFTSEVQESLTASGVPYK